MARLVKVSDVVINLDQVTIIHGDSQWAKVEFGQDYWVQFPCGLDEFTEMVNDTPALADENLQKELARVTRDYEELARECDRLKEMVGQLFNANGRLVYANILKERRKGPRRWR